MTKESPEHETITWLQVLKQCVKCGEVKKRYNFSRNRRSKDGCDRRCKQCDKDRPRRHANPFYILRNNAKSRGKVFTLTMAEYQVLIESNACHYCGRGLPVSGGLDRIDNSLGYEPGNVVPCCTDCNYIRGKILSYEEMLEIAPKLQEIFSRRERLAEQELAA
jgi:hypothetical protein